MGGREGGRGRGRQRMSGKRDSGADERGRRGRKRRERTEKENRRKSWRKGDGGEVIYVKGKEVRRKGRRVPRSSSRLK